MKTLIKDVTVYDKRSPFYNKKVNVVVQSGKILEISDKKIDGKYDEVSGKSLILIPSIVDINAQSGTFDNSEAETLKSLQEAGARGGVSHIAHIPTSSYPIVRKSDINHLTSQNRDSVCQIMPTGSIYDENTQSLTEMMEMKRNGAVAFTNGNNAISDNKYLRLALEYIKGFEGKLMIHPEVEFLTHNGQVNQSIVSTQMGFKGIPKQSEIIAVNEILELLEYTDSNALIMGITCSENIKSISKFNKSSKKATTATSTLHISLDETKCLDYDPNFKINPPLRSKSDVKALTKALINGEIDILYSQHTPITAEGKVCEFDLADYGVINIQTSLLSAIKALGIEHLDKIVDTMSLNPANYLGIEMPIFDKNAIGNYTVIDIEDETTFDSKTNKSQSKNTPFLNTKLPGKVKGLIANGTESFFE